MYRIPPTEPPGAALVLQHLHPFTDWFCLLLGVVQGTVHGLLGALFGKKFSIRVMPKSAQGTRILPVSCILPFISLAAFSLIYTCFISQNILLAACAAQNLFMAWAVLAAHYAENFTMKTAVETVKCMVEPLSLLLLMTGVAWSHVARTYSGTSQHAEGLGIICFETLDLGGMVVCNVG